MSVSMATGGLRREKITCRNLKYVFALPDNVIVDSLLTPPTVRMEKFVS